MMAGAPGLVITSLALSHFRSHLETRIEADARPVALFGPNGAGKTNVLEAISLLSPGRGLRGATVAEMARRPETIGWKIAAGLETPVRRREIDLRAEIGGPRQTLVDGKAAPQAELGRIARVLWLVPAMDRLWIEGAEGRRRFLDRMTLGFVPEHAEASLGYDRAMRERNRLIRDGTGNPRWFAALEARMAETGAAIAANRRHALGRIAAAQADAETAFPAAELTLGVEGPEAAEDLARALERGRARDVAAGRTLIGPHRSDLAALYVAKGVPARDCSTGEQKALLVSLILANARALTAETGAAPILLLDEVAAHLDADRRAALYDEVAALGSQAWMTGTGRELFEPLGDRARHLSLAEGPHGSVVEVA
jgi:DNA replication and repair protein RecF